MKKRFKVSVDTGSIYCLLSKNKGKKSIPLSKGKYKVSLLVKNCWNGRVENYGFLDVKEKSFLNFDDAGIIDLDNEIFVKEEDLHKQGCLLSTGGDGTFMVEVTLKKVSKIGKDPYQLLLKEAKEFFKKNKYSEETSKIFVDKFFKNVYYRKINEIIEKKRSQQIRKMLKDLKKLSSKLS